MKLVLTSAVDTPLSFTDDCTCRNCMTHNGKPESGDRVEITEVVGLAEAIPVYGRSTRA